MIEAPDSPPRIFEIEFYEEGGRQPVLDWIKEDLTPIKRRALGTAMRTVLQVNGVEVCRSAWGKKVHAEGVYEFRLRMSGKAVITLAVLRLRALRRRRQRADKRGGRAGRGTT